MLTTLTKTLGLFSQRSTYALIGAFLIHLTLGNKYTLSNVNTYLTSYMRRHGSPRATYGNSIWFSTCYSIGQPTSMVIGGYLERKFSTRLTCLLGCLLYSVSIMLTSLSVDQGFLMALLTYGLVPGLGCGLAYMTPMSNGFGWFPNNRGIVAGGILAGLGLGPFVFNMVQTNFVNPLNLSPEPNAKGYFTQDSILNRVPQLFVLMGFVYGLMELIGCSLLFEPPANHNEPKPQDETSQQQQEQRQHQQQTTTSQVTGDTPCRHTQASDMIPTICRRVSVCDEQNIMQPIARKNSTSSNSEPLIVKQVIRKREFIILFLAFGLTTQGMLFVNSQLKKYGQTYIMDDNFLAWSGSIGSLANCLGRVVWGLAIDRLSFRACLATTSSLFCLACLLTPFEFILTSKSLFLAVTICLFGFSSGWVCIFPVHISRVFGRTNGSIMYGLIYLSQPTISLLSAPALQHLIDHTSRFVPIYCVMCLNLAGLLIYLVSYPSTVDKPSVSKLTVEQATPSEQVCINLETINRRVESE